MADLHGGRRLAALGRLDLALAQLSEVWASIGDGRNVYDRPELLRLHGEVLMQAGNERGAEQAFRESMELADRNALPCPGALRSATSLARLLVQQSRTVEARTILADTYARFERRLRDLGSPRPRRACWASSMRRRPGECSTAVTREQNEAAPQYFPEFLQPVRIPSLKAIALEREVGAGLLAAVKGSIGLVASPKPVEIDALFEKSRRLRDGRPARDRSPRQAGLRRPIPTADETSGSPNSPYGLGCTRLHSSLNSMLSNMAVALMTLLSRISKNQA